MANTRGETIAIVGGGITGLFCAYILAQNGKSVRLFEASNRLGGRIRTIRLKGDNTQADADWEPDALEFCAEFGPMRLELDKQLLVKALLDRLNIEPKKLSRQSREQPEKEGKAGPKEPRGAAAAYLVEFPPYTSPIMSSDPKYELRQDEEGKTPLQLLQMAMLRVIAHLHIPDSCDFFEQQETLINNIKLAAATREGVEPIFADWLKNLGPKHYWEIQTQGCIGNAPLYALGFWNLLSDYLSHEAIVKLRDLGTFYHLLPENPNAAEWLVWWLIGFGTTEHLQGIFGGMECIVDRLVEELKVLRLHDGAKLTLETDSRVIAVTKNGKFKLIFDGETKPREGSYDRVILALPKSPLEKIVHASPDAFKLEKEILSLLDSAFAFPMVKLFVVVKNRWWEEASRANRYATKVPTRELHYWKGHTNDSKQGLIMLYTDRPASSFWANYLPPEEQFDVYWARNPPPQKQTVGGQHNKSECSLVDGLRERLIKKAVQYVNENNLPDITDRDVAWYGIRDWGREPFGGANHAWRPERQYWVVMRRLASIGKQDRTPSIHICGEAYSDYHGFIEGSLRSAVYTLHCILKQGPGNQRLKWLKRAKIEVEKKYLKALRDWVKNLDEIPTVPNMKGSHLLTSD